MWNRILFLSVVAAIGITSATLCAPALPSMMNYFATHFANVQFTIGFFLVGNAFGQFGSGPLSDLFGQRKVLLGGLLLYICASCCCALADHLYLVWIARFFQGMGTAAGPVLARAITTNQFPPNKSAQVQCYIGIGVGLAFAFATLCGSRLTVVSWRGNFWLAASFGLILLVWALSALPKTAPVKREISLQAMLGRMIRLFRHPGFLGPTIYHSISYTLLYTYFGCFPFLLMQIYHQDSPLQTGIYLVLINIFYLLGALLASFLASERIVAIAMALQLLSGALLALAPLGPWTFAALSLFNFSIGIILPLTAASALAPFAGGSAGTASSTMGLTYRILGAIIPAFIAKYLPVGAITLGGAIVLLSFGGLLLFRRLRTAPVLSS